MSLNERNTLDSTSLELRRVRNRELELKRSRGEISCAECRRLKLKCDKKVPCSSCSRRGCQNICPNGILSSSQGSRFVITDTDKLQRKITEMSKRISQLEDALQIEHAGRSTSTHPLLSEELLVIKQSVDAPDQPDFKRDPDDAEEELTGAMGTLSIGSEGKAMRFLGASATEHTLLMDMLDQQSAVAEPFDWSSIAPELASASQMWPFSPVYYRKAECLNYVVIKIMPTWERATALCDYYFQNLSWFFRPIDHAQVYEELLPLVYKSTLKGMQKVWIDGEDYANTINAHDLALLNMIFACGASGDLSQNARNDEAESYQHLALVLLGMDSIFDKCCLSTVQAVCMLGCFEAFCGRREVLDSSWKYFSLSASLATSIGLHRDPARWKIEPKIIQRRRRIFWELYMLDNWKSLGTGRPPTFTPNVVDCEFPIDEEATLDEDGKIIPSVWRWKHLFTRDILTSVTEKMCGARALKYSEILELDRMIRDFDCHPRATEPLKENYDSPEEILAVLQPQATIVFREIALMYIHRNFFARAILDFPGDPMRSPFAPSFLAAYRSSTAMLKVMREYFESVKQLLFRVWPIWAHALASAVIVGSVVARVPKISFAPAAFIELELAIALFEKASVHPVVSYGLPLLLRIRDQAHNALYDARSSSSKNLVKGNDKQNLPTLQYDSGSVDQELNILRGTTRFVERKSTPCSSRSSAKVSTPPTASSSSAPSPASAIHEESEKPVIPRSHGTEKMRMFYGNMDELMAPSPFVQIQGPEEIGQVPFVHSSSPYTRPDFQDPVQSRIDTALWPTSLDQNPSEHLPHGVLPTTRTIPYAAWSPMPPADASRINEFDYSDFSPLNANSLDQSPSFMPLPVSLTSSVNESSIPGNTFPAQYQTDEGTMAEAWKSFVQDSGFADPSVFQSWESIDKV